MKHWNWTRLWMYNLYTVQAHQEKDASQETRKTARSKTFSCVACTMVCTISMHHHDKLPIPILLAKQKVSAIFASLRCFCKHMTNAKCLWLFGLLWPFTADSLCVNISKREKHGTCPVLGAQMDQKKGCKMCLLLRSCQCIQANVVGATKNGPIIWGLFCKTCSQKLAQVERLKEECIYCKQQCALRKQNSKVTVAIVLLATQSYKVSLWKRGWTCVCDLCFQKPFQLLGRIFWSVANYIGTIRAQNGHRKSNYVLNEVPLLPPKLKLQPTKPVQKLRACNSLARPMHLYAFFRNRTFVHKVGIAN